MIRVFLVEDEPPALAQLERALHAWDPSVVIAGTARYSGMAFWRPTLVYRTGTILAQPTPTRA